MKLGLSKVERNKAQEDRRGEGRGDERKGKRQSEREKEKERNCSKPNPILFTEKVQQMHSSCFVRYANI